MREERIGLDRIEKRIKERGAKKESAGEGWGKENG